MTRPQSLPVKIKDMTPEQKKEYYRNYYAKNTDKYKARNDRRERTGKPRYINALQAKVKDFENKILEYEEMKRKDELMRFKEEENKRIQEENKRKEEERLKLEFENLKRQQQKLNYISHLKNQLPNIVF